MGHGLNCTDFENWAALYAANELDQAVRLQVEEHAQACASCARLLSHEVGLRGIIVAHGNTSKELDPSGLLLARCRSELAEALDKTEKDDDRSGWRALLFPVRWVAGFRCALALHPERSAAALLIAGALGGLIAHAWYREAGLPLPGEPVMTVSAAQRITDQDLETIGVEGVRLDPRSGTTSPRVEVRMISERPLVLEGSPDDAEMRHLLTYIIAHPQRFDPEVRLDSLDALRTRISDPLVRGALCRAARQDRNPAVRLRALEALHGLESDPDVLRALLDALAADENSGVRIEAVNALIAALDGPDHAAPSLDAGAMNVLRDRMQNDPNRYIRLRSATMLERLISSNARSASLQKPFGPSR